MISPCKCCGDQKYVHLSCLRRWQRMELVNQPAHPLFWTERERYKICSVCKGNFSCPLPTQYELVETFTGKQIGDLIQPHSIIGATTLFDSVCNMYIRKTPFREKMLSHWINSAYLICRINEGQLGKYYINDKKTQCEWYVYLFFPFFSLDFKSEAEYHTFLVLHTCTGLHTSPFKHMRRHCHLVHFLMVPHFNRFSVEDVSEMLRVITRSGNLYSERSYQSC